MIIDDKFTNKFKELDELQFHVFGPEVKLNEKIRNKRVAYLLKIPIFSLILQKKGYQNFRIIVDNIRMVKVGFGEVVFCSN